MALLWIPSYLAYQFSVESYDLFFDAARSISVNPPICYGVPSCRTFYLNGGLGLTTPDPFGDNLFPEADVIIVKQTLGLLASLWLVDSAEVSSIDASQIDCFKSGAENMAFQICLAPSSLYTNHFIAGNVV